MKKLVKVGNRLYMSTEVTKYGQGGELSNTNRNLGLKKEIVDYLSFEELKKI